MWHAYCYHRVCVLVSEPQAGRIWKGRQDYCEFGKGLRSHLLVVSALITEMDSFVYLLSSLLVFDTPVR